MGVEVNNARRLVELALACLDGSATGTPAAAVLLTKAVEMLNGSPAATRSVAAPVPKAKRRGWTPAQKAEQRRKMKAFWAKKKGK